MEGPGVTRREHCSSRSAKDGTVVVRGGGGRTFKARLGGTKDGGGATRIGGVLVGNRSLKGSTQQWEPRGHQN